MEMRFFVHATEDRNKVLEAAHNLLPLEGANKLVFKKSNLKGEYGNPILFYQVYTEDSSYIATFLSKININLSSSDKESLLKEFNMRLHRGNLYIRFDKQSAYKGIITLCRVDPIHIKIKFKTFQIKEIIDICQKFGVLP
jgi:RNA binding exosome subunit